MHGLVALVIQIVPYIAFPFIQAWNFLLTTYESVMFLEKLFLEKLETWCFKQLVLVLCNTVYQPFCFY